MGPDPICWSPYKKRLGHTEIQEMHTHRAKATLGPRWKTRVATCRPRREAAGETKPAESVAFCHGSPSKLTLSVEGSILSVDMRSGCSS